ncbi:MAG: ATP-binding cassette domain-containing protein, partial [Bdellovibrionales bacterium]|nr:ATP-binding cassette domain-containing protein [Bdellovibrionales bacterium]
FTFRDLLEMGFSPYLPKVHDVEEVAKRTGIHDYIVSLPNGYDTIFGSGFDGACELPSGGQRQMIALTRTLMSDPKIVILDEPTANLDGDHEGDVTRFIQEHLKGKCTVFYITHDMGALRKLGVDQVVSVVDGAVAEVGTPEELLQREGGYFRAMFDQEKERYGDGSAESEDEYEE